jgi:Family of unknown function (DUF5686)
VFTNYNLTPNFPSNFFGNEIFNGLNATKTNDLKTWENLRPIPLTSEEIQDYARKDSIQTVHHSKPYIDSVMRKENRFKPMALLMGYTYRNDYKSTKIGFGSVLSAVNFNAVQGLNIALPFNYTKDFKENMFADTRSQLRIDPSLNYSFGEKKVRAEINGSYLFNRFKRDKLSLSFGQKVQQFNQNDIISASWAMYQALYEKRHIYFVYDKIFAKMAFSREIVNGLTGQISLEAAQRDPLSISTQYSFKKKDDIYQINNPIPTSSGINTTRSKAVIADLNLAWTPNQKYTTYPFGKFNESPRYPIFKLHLQAALGNGTREFADFSRLALSIEQQSLPVGLVGYSEIRAEFGTFLTQKNVLFADYKHFNGNELGLANSNNYMKGFMSLPYYGFSTTSTYFMANWQHHFEGFLLGKLPLIRRLGLKEIVRVAYLNSPEIGDYAEAGFGIDNIGYGLFRLIRVDCNWQYRDKRINKNPKWLVGINLPF